MDRKRLVRIPRKLFTADFRELVNDDSISIIIELVGGTAAAGEIVLEAIRAGKHVVTANKALLAHRGEEILAEASANGVRVAFEASVGGGIPVIKAVRESYVANNILSMHGIMNGTCNYVLHKMSEDGKGFEEALLMAQREGYAEADPSFDVDGTDAAHKLSVLIALAYGFFPKLEDIRVEGIRNVRPTDVEFADRLGYRIKLLAAAKLRDGGVEAGVYPALVRKNTQLADVKDAYNAIHVVGDVVGPTMLYGMGAGMLPTASAVVGDAVSIAGSVGNAAEFPGPGPGRETAERLPVLDPSDAPGRRYLRFRGDDVPGTLGKITTVLGKNGISIESVIQEGRKAGGGEVPIVMMTHDAAGGDLRKGARRDRGLRRSRVRGGLDEDRGNIGPPASRSRRNAPWKKDRSPTPRSTGKFSTRCPRGSWSRTRISGSSPLTNPARTCSTSPGERPSGSDCRNSFPRG